MAKVCRFTPTASKDLEEILAYVAQWGGLDAADLLLHRLNGACQKLITYPGMGRGREELPLGIRCFSVKDYLICYRPSDEGVEILRIVSGYRDLEALSFE
jgi:toxin ParE1/3/4